MDALLTVAIVMMKGTWHREGSRDLGAGEGAPGRPDLRLPGQKELGDWQLLLRGGH